MNIDFEPNPKQFQMLEAFDEPDVTEVAYGGAASGGKSYGICALHILKSLTYNGIRSLIGREELKKLKETTIMTFFKVCQSWGLKMGTHYTYNISKETVTFFNGSVILFKGLKYIPSDPQCTWLGSLEITFASVDEAGEIHVRVKEVLHSRCGRWLNKKFGIKPMLFLACNPSRNFLFSLFYKLAQKGELPKHRRFIPALITDHGRTFEDFDPEEYAEHLRQTLSFEDYQRLVLGKWEFDDDPNACTTFTNVNLAFDYARPQDFTETKYITADIAFESDKCIIIVWSGLDVLQIIDHDKNEKPEERILELQQEHNVARRHICYDATGAGNYLKNYLPGGYVFHSGARPITTRKEEKEFEHLKTQVYFKLAEAFNKETIRIFDKEFQDDITDECLQIKTIPKEKIDGVIKMIKKDEIKKLIGRSPDILDALSMRFVYEVKAGFQSMI